MLTLVRKIFNLLRKNISDILVLSGWKSLITPLPTEFEFSDLERERLLDFEDKKSQINEQRLKDILAEFEKLYVSEQGRSERIEAKANAILGFTGIVVTITFGLFSIQSISGVCVLIPLLTAGIFLGGSIISAVRATKVGDYKFTLPNESDLWNMDRSEANVWREQAYSLLYSYYKNRHIINAKASSVIDAQNFFRNSIIFLLIGLLFLSFSKLPLNTSILLPSNQITSTATNTTIPPSNTPILATETATNTLTVSPSTSPTTRSTATATAIQPSTTP